MAITLIQQARAGGSGTQISVTILAPTAGNFLVAVVTAVTKGSTVTSIAGGGVTWVKAKSSNTDWACDIWYGLNSTGVGTNVLVTLSPGYGTNQTATIAEFSGVATSSTQGNSATATSQSATPDAGSVTPSQGKECLLVAAAASQVGQASGPTGGFGNFTTGDATSYAAYRIVPAALGAYDCSWGNGNVYATWDACLVEFHAVPVAAGPVTAVRSYLHRRLREFR